MSRKPDLTKGGIITNLDDPLTAEQKAESHEADRQVGVVDQAKKEARERGGDTFAMYTDKEYREGTAEIHQTKDYANLDPRTLGGLPRIRASIRLDPSSPEGWQWILDEREYEAVAEGYFCPNCLMAQKEPQVNMCQWRDRPADSDIPGCGYSRIADMNIGTEAYK